ncbi:MAG TPA: TraR/DksA C4-type zinc finger protein [Candidatus Limnocylindria bacterium]|nr:TraR/DksA C4-type zinc finger protein [Candidatus Limnocylindria bacterium]
MARPTKKKSSAKKSTARKPRPTRKVHAKKARRRSPRRPASRQAHLKRSVRGTKTARPSAKARRQSTESPAILLGLNHREKRLDPFMRKQKQKLLQLRDAMVDSMAGVAQGTLRSRAEGSEASAFGMHQADAGSDAYDRDFALSLLSQEQDALYEIDQALKRIEVGTYGKCEMSGKPIPHARLEAIPFARFTVQCQSQLEKQSRASRVRQSVTSLFGLTEEEGSDAEEEEAPPTEVKE